MYSDKLSDRKLKEKEKFDNKHSRTLKPFTLDTTVSFLNADLKTWSIDTVIPRSPDNRSYYIKTESGQVISCNRVHLHKTNVEFVPPGAEHSASFKSFEGENSSTTSKHK